MKRITVIMHTDDGLQTDIEIPTDVTASALLSALNLTYRAERKQAVAIRTENPLTYLSGNAKVEDAMLHTGTELFFVED